MKREKTQGAFYLQHVGNQRFRGSEIKMHYSQLFMLEKGFY